MEYLIIALCVIAYLGIGVGVTKVVFVLNKFLYNADNVNDQMGALCMTIVWPVVVIVGGIVLMSNKLFKRIL